MYVKGPEEANLYKQKSEDFTRSYEYAVSFWADKNVQQLESSDCYKYTKYYGIVYFERMNFMVYELYHNKAAIFLNKKQ